MGLFSGWWRRKDVENAVESILDSKLQEAVTSLRSVDALVREKEKLTGDLIMLRAERAAMAQELETERAEIERERVEIKHKLGLEVIRQRQEAEAGQKELAWERATLKKEKEIEIKAARLEALEQATKEAREQVREFQERQERMIEHLLGSLPTAKMFHTNAERSTVISND